MPMKNSAASEWTHAADENAQGRRRATSWPCEEPAWGPDPVVAVPVMTRTTNGTQSQRPRLRKYGSRTSSRAPGSVEVLRVVVEQRADRDHRETDHEVQ